MKSPEEYDNAHIGTLDPVKYPSGRVKDETYAGAGDGTPIQGQIVTDIQYAILNVMSANGVVPSEVTENAEDVNDFLTALVNMFKGKYNPFMNYAHFRYGEPTGTNGQTFVTGQNIVNLNTTVENGLGATLSANTIVGLPAGTYRVKAYSVFTNAVTNNRNRLNIYDGSNVIAKGIGLSGSTDDDTVFPTMADTFTIGSPQDINLRMYCNVGSSPQFPVSDGIEEIYSGVEIWKLD